MKKFLSLLLASSMVFSLAACGGQDAVNKAEEQETEEIPETEYGENGEVLVNSASKKVHKIGVLVYSNTDEEVLGFRDYLESYVEKCFNNVDFIYSDSITSAEECMKFLGTAAEQGVEGIMSFNSYDLKSEVDFCTEHEMYYIIASGTVADESFTQVEDNPYFLGEVGPGKEIEYQAGVDMADHFAVEHPDDHEYFILSGGAGMGNEMHLLRTVGILDTLQKAYGVQFEESSEEIAMASEPKEVTAGELKICVCPGYLDFDVFVDAAKAEYEKDAYSTVLSVLPIAEMQPVIEEKDANLGIIDSYNTRNWKLFTDGKLDYLTGKFTSSVAISFIAMYNAIAGFGDDFRVDGKAFKIIQGFWTSDSKEDYEEKYTLSSSVVINAYNFEDMFHLCKYYNMDATIDDLIELASAYSYEEAYERRYGK